MKSDGSVFTLENEELLIMVERHGSQLSRIYDKKADREILWSCRPGSMEPSFTYPFSIYCQICKWKIPAMRERNTIFLLMDLQEIWTLSRSFAIWMSVHTY